ncbi:hypothetical protein AVEN_208681-1 [Araneus ventricosus]|uniref:CRESS-DNA virus Rep endonuclease domain-containing protein n=1 Tax=Araneus ventricosus TaxID=182803 RepID=A0A4Y2KW84_ARAVE|nr:hypothetical protein AVEN_208681-1 [Araneus ventricosus]
MQLGCCAIGNWYSTQYVLYGICFVKDWYFTTFRVSPEPVFHERIYEHLVLGRDSCPDTGCQHLQGFVYFNERQRFLAFKKLFPDSHLEVAKGSPEQNKVYCTKDGNALNMEDYR